MKPLKWCRTNTLKVFDNKEYACMVIIYFKIHDTPTNNSYYICVHIIVIHYEKKEPLTFYLFIDRYPYNMYKIQYCILNVEVYLNYECLNTPRNNSIVTHTLAERKECMCVCV